MKCYFLIKFVPDFLILLNFLLNFVFIVSENSSISEKGWFYLFLSNPNKKVCFIFILKNNVHICIKLFRNDTFC